MVQSTSNDINATELQDLNGDSASRPPPARASHNDTSKDLPSQMTPTAPHEAAQESASNDNSQSESIPSSIRHFWKTHVRVSVPAASARDHLANERTFLGHLRTSLALSMMGVLTIQLFRIQSEPIGGGMVSYRDIGTPLGLLFFCAAMIVVGLGACRFWRQQAAMVRGRVWAGGWEVLVIMGLALMLCVVSLALVLVADRVVGMPE